MTKESKRKKKSKKQRNKEEIKKTIWKKMIWFSLVMIVVLGASVLYIWRAEYYATHFYPNTWINGMDCSYMQAEEVKSLLQKNVDTYQLTIHTKEGDAYSVTGPQLHMKYADDGGVNQILGHQEPVKWIVKSYHGEKHEVSANITFDVESVLPILRSLPFMRPENIIQPTDAYMMDTEQGYSIVPEVEGNALDEAKVLQLMLDAIRGGITEISLLEGDCYLKPTIYQNDQNMVNTVNTLNHLIRANLTYNVCGETFLVDQNVLKAWLIQTEDGTYTIDNNKIISFIDDLANMRDSYGGSRVFTTHAGKEITLKTNRYGWKVNREESVKNLSQAIADGKQGEMELVYSRKAKGTGKNDLGSVYIEISIKDQTMWCYKDGQVYVETPVVTGKESNPDWATPRNGCWYIYKKATEYTMKGPIQEDGEPEYTAFVHYWMPFNGGVGIHDLASRGNNFGGSIYINNGSHGCINTPYNAVKKIFEVSTVGTPVIVY